MEPWELAHNGTDGLRLIRLAEATFCKKHLQGFANGHSRWASAARSVPSKYFCGFLQNCIKKRTWQDYQVRTISPTPPPLYSSTPLLPYSQPAFTSQHPLGFWSVSGLLLLSSHLCPYYVPLILHSSFFILH